MLFFDLLFQQFLKLYFFLFLCQQSKHFFIFRFRLNDIELFGGRHININSSFQFNRCIQQLPHQLQIVIVQRINNFYREETLKYTTSQQMDFYKKITHLIERGQVDEAYQIIQGIPENSINQEIVKANYFCLMSIANHYQVGKAVTLLQQCLNEKQITRITCLFTKCNIAFAFSKMQQPEKQYNLLSQILNDHFGEYFILKNLLNKNKKQKLLIEDYIFLLKNCLQKLAQICLKNNWTERSKQFQKAFQKMKKHEINFSKEVQKQNEKPSKLCKRQNFMLDKGIADNVDQRIQKSKVVKTLGQKSMNIVI